MGNFGWDGDKRAPRGWDLICPTCEAYADFGECEECGAYNPDPDKEAYYETHRDD